MFQKKILWSIRTKKGAQDKLLYGMFKNIASLCTFSNVKWQNRLTSKNTVSPLDHPQVSLYYLFSTRRKATSLEQQIQLHCYSCKITALMMEWLH